MTPLKLAPLALLLGAVAASPERWLWNARERTATAIAALAAGDAPAATAAAETAARVAPDDPVVRYNAGATHLATAESPELDADSRQAAARAALPHLEASTEADPGGIAPDAWYDLGTARLAAGEAEAAVDALSEALRREPGRAEAKHNLELALRALEQERERQQQQQQQQQRSPSSDDSEDSDASDTGEPQQQRNQDQRGEPDERKGEQPQPGERSDGEPQPQPGRPESSEKSPPRQGPLPGFVDQPQLNASQAAALLEAVENRERQERRQAAAARARQRSGEEKDW